jgi:hypothetical protein
MSPYDLNRSQLSDHKRRATLARIGIGFAAVLRRLWNIAAAFVVLVALGAISQAIFYPETFIEKAGVVAEKLRQLAALLG